MGCKGGECICLFNLDTPGSLSDTRAIGLFVRRIRLVGRFGQMQGSRGVPTPVLLRPRFVGQIP
jgi:hypothetical protein